MRDVLAQWRRYFALLDARASDVVLDVGCHEGDAIDLLLTEIPVGKVVGVDRNELKVAVATARFDTDPRVQIVQADAVALPFDDASFDRVFSAETIEWASSPLAAVREMRRVLTSGGRALVVHTDFDTQVFAHADLATTRSFIHAFADAGPGGTLGRDLVGLCRTAGFGRVEPVVHVLQSTSFKPSLYPQRIVAMMRSWLVEQASIEAEAFDMWVAELERRDLERTFFYSVNRNICICES